MSLSGLSGLSGLGLSGGAGAWSPAGVSGAAFVADPVLGLYQNDDGTTAASADGNRVRYLPDTGPGLDPATSAALTRAYRLGSRFGDQPGVFFGPAAATPYGLTSACAVAPDVFTAVFRVTVGHKWDFAALLTVGDTTVRLGQQAGGVKILTQSDPQGTRNSTASLTPATAYTVSVRSDGADIAFRVDGVAAGTVAARASSTPGDVIVGDGGGGFPAEGVFGRVFVGREAVSDADLTRLEEWVAEGTAAGLYVAGLPLVGVAGDSISCGFGGPLWAALVNDGLTNRTQWAVTAIPSQQAFQAALDLPLGYHDAGRAVEVACLWAGTNNLAASATTSATYDAITAGAGYLASAWDKVIVADILPRSSFSGTQETRRGEVNALLAADFPDATGEDYVYSAGVGVTYADYCVRVSEIPGLQDTGVNYTDGTHPDAAGQALVAAAWAAALGLVGVT